MTQASFFSFLGKAMALTIVGAGAYGAAKQSGASTLLQPENLAALLSEVEGVLHPNPPAPPAVPTPAA